MPRAVDGLFPKRPHEDWQLSYSSTMTRTLTSLTVCLLLAVSCGGSADNENAADQAAVSGLVSGSCLAGDPECVDGADAGQAAPLPSAIALSDPNDANAPLQVTFGGFFYSDGTVSQLCSSLAESFPPQCGSLVIDIEAPLDVVLDFVAESFGNPEEAKINIDQGIYWTDEWVNLSGVLAANRLVLE